MYSVARISPRSPERIDLLMGSFSRIKSAAAVLPSRRRMPAMCSSEA
jgi:hypothetical protein